MTIACKDCGTQLNEGEAATFAVCDECWDKAYPKVPRCSRCDELSQAGEFPDGMCSACHEFTAEKARAELAEQRLAIAVRALREQRQFVAVKIQKAARPEDDPPWLYDINVAMDKACKDALAEIEAMK